MIDPDSSCGSGRGEKRPTKTPMRQVMSVLDRTILKAVVCQTLLSVGFESSATDALAEEFSVAGTYRCTTYGKTTNVVMWVHQRDA